MTPVLNLLSAHRSIRKFTVIHDTPHRRAAADH
jgi:hypothetical protein